MYARTHTVKPNPFKMVIYQPQKAQVFQGDLRQLDPIFQSSDHGPTLWRYLASEAYPETYLEKCQAFLGERQLTVETLDASASLQYFELTAQAQLPESFDVALKVIAAWAEDKINSSLHAHLFKNQTRLNAAQLKAFGQLFYDCNGSESNTRGTMHWFNLAQAIFDHFGDKHFSIWLNYVLSPLPNWRECLDKSEIDAMVQSIHALKDHGVYQRIWWQLIKTHATSVGAFRYAQVWLSFAELIKYLKNPQIRINEQAWHNYLKHAYFFNAQVFLNRLYSVLKSCEQQLFTHNNQQNILDHLDKIDWRHDGFYYASTYESYRYWDKALNLKGFHKTYHGKQSYQAPDIDFDSITDPITHYLRFAACHMQLSCVEFAYLTQELQALPSPIKKHNVRLIIAFLAWGIDDISTLKSNQIVNLNKNLNDFHSCVSWLNALLVLEDNTLVKGRLKVSFDHIIALCQLLEPMKLQDLDARKNQKQHLTLVNRLGRALQWCFTKSQEKRLATLRSYVEGHSVSDLLKDEALKTHPWTIATLEQTSPFQQNLTSARISTQSLVLKQFHQQITSISIPTSNWLPSIADLIQSYRAICEAEDADKLRQKYIDSWIDSGCDVIDQHSSYRQLNHEELTFVQTFLDNHLKPSFKKQNNALLTLFCQKYLAVNINQHGKTILEHLLKFFIELDNKLHYNEIGQIAGYLNKKAHTHDAFFAAAQLTFWLKTIYNRNRFAREHFPLNLLDELFTYITSNQKNSLMNQRLSCLRDQTNDQALAQKVEQIGQLSLSNAYQLILIKPLLDDCSDDYFELVKTHLMQLHESHINVLKRRDMYERLFMRLNHEKSFEHIHMILKVLTYQLDESLVECCTPNVLKLWQKTQYDLAEWYLSGHVSLSDLCTVLARINDAESANFSPKAALLCAILVQASTHTHAHDSQQNLILNINQVSKKLKQLPDLAPLALYYSENPELSLEQLHEICTRELIDTPNHQKISHLIHVFESKLRATDHKGQSKRLYSTSSADRDNLTRVLNTIERKGQSRLTLDEKHELLALLYYTEHYSLSQNLATISISNLRQLLFETIQAAHDPDVSAFEHKQFVTQTLAVLREIVLRKTGKWANHTQMLDLLYAALHNDESIIHQVRTGEGKSIISVMRASYLALNGKNVNIFSSKESLSFRDFEEFWRVYKAMGLECAYITPDAPATAFKAPNNGTGNIHYATIGNFSLYLSRLVWEGQITPFKSTQNIAFLDEADHILLDERTQYNFAINVDNQSAYNFDACLYRLTYEFYLNNLTSFVRDKKGCIKISRLNDLQNLCEFLQKNEYLFPEESTFFQKYIIPALDTHDNNVIERRDKRLLQLLNAAHSAHHLKEGQHYCIRTEQKRVYGAFIKVRDAKVMLNNQVILGSTYSELVHQFLHTKLNYEASQKGEPPNFFIEPESLIALSQNPSAFLKTQFSKLEGCTGTAGSRQELSRYHNDYDLTHVIKVPTHRPNRTTFEPPVFCENFEAQMAELAKIIKNNTHRPLLITCKDDKAVKKIHRNLSEILPKYPLVGDTNDSGLSEKDIIKKAGLKGAITISARLGRGTDIKPGVEDGLGVIRTYSTRARTAKQERGRQGRNNAQGMTQEVLDITRINKDYKKFERHQSERVQALFEEETQALTKKHQKHQDK
ncbi:MAG TPA: hypothetical protein DEO98_05570, partial [Legionellales bacterium]|nr:hypothetical protein [Legionellales bacterium]